MKKITPPEFTKPEKELIIATLLYFRGSVGVAKTNPEKTLLNNILKKLFNSFN